MSCRRLYCRSKVILLLLRHYVHSLSYSTAASLTTMKQVSELKDIREYSSHHAFSETCRELVDVWLQFRRAALVFVARYWKSAYRGCTKKNPKKYQKRVRNLKGIFLRSIAISRHSQHFDRTLLCCAIFHQRLHDTVDLLLVRCATALPKKSGVILHLPASKTSTYSGKSDFGCENADPRDAWALPPPPPGKTAGAISLHKSYGKNGGMHLKRAINDLSFASAAKVWSEAVDS